MSQRRFPGVSALASRPSSPSTSRTWLITGCSSGIGRALAERVLARCERVVCTARDATRLADLAASRHFGVTLGELKRLAKGVEPHELDRLKARVKSGLIMQQESSSARAGSIAREWYHLGRVRSMEEIGKLVESLSCESLGRYLAANPPGDFTIVTLGPQPLEIREVG